ncbi:MAG: ATP-binding protein, partial [Marinirhabdus sp.]|nr:ATP-binding protein [Marinirhabdus sp.]
RQKISVHDVLPIAAGQIRSENVKLNKANNYLFCDTNLLELQVYCEYYYGQKFPSELKEAAKHHKYHYYFLTGIDVVWEPDDLRDRPFDRSTLFRSFETALKKRDLPYTLLQGSEQERLQKAIAVINNTFSN